MEIKAELTYPYSEQEKMNFIVQQNHNNGYEIRYVEREIEEEIEVLEWDTIEVEEQRQKIDPETGEPMYDEEGNPIMETIIVEKQVPRMIEEPVIDPETGEPMIDPETGEIITHQVQAHHTETITRLVKDIQAWGYTEEEKEEQEKERKDKMTLTPADVERALYKAKGMDFDDLKELIAQGTGIDLKALAIEFRATTFYRGAMFGSGKLFDVVGALLGYMPEDIDYLFEHKELPVKPEPIEEENKGE